jgi:hypothetical protein
MRHIGYMLGFWLSLAIVLFLPLVASLLLWGIASALPSFVSSIRAWGETAPAIASLGGKLCGVAIGGAVILLSNFFSDRVL